jgi:hypothetical protein
MSAMEHASGAVRRPLAWRIHPGDAAGFAAQGKGCETRRCRNPIAVVTWRWFRSAAAGRVLVAEHFVCDQHGQEFAARHHVEIEPSPPEPSRRRDAPGAGAGNSTGKQEPRS